MSRSYNKLWHILIDRNMTKTQLREAANINDADFYRVDYIERISEQLEMIKTVL